MRNEKQRKAAETRRRFLAAWERGLRNEMELAAAAGCSTRNVGRLKAERASGELAEKMARDLREDAAERGEGPPVLAVAPATAQAPEPLTDPGPDFDHIGVVRALCAANSQSPRDRIRAAEVIERRRQYDLDHKIGAGAANMSLDDWLGLRLEDIPEEARPRLAGVLAETLVRERNPALGGAQTTEGQARVWYLTGQMLSPEDAEVVLAELQPAVEGALRKAAEVAAARRPAVEPEPIRPEDYLDHVPESGSS